MSTTESLGVAIAAESRAVYGEGLVRSPLLVGELAVLRHRMEVAVALVRLGRHAPGDRALRSTVAALARRCDWSRAGEGSRTLASSLLTRGRPREAQSTLVEAERYAAVAPDEAGAIEVAILRGAASTDLGKLDEAERILCEATAAARASDDPARLTLSTLALARCLFWRGRYGEADQLLESSSASSLSHALAAREACIASRVAVGRRDIGAAVSVAARTLSSTDRAPDPALRAQAAYASAFVHLAVGDLVAVDHEVARCVAASRAARDPIRALKARLIGAESARRQGRGAVAVALLARVDRLARGVGLPVTVSARCALLRDLLAGPSTARVRGGTARSTREIVDRHVATSGLRALELFAPVEPEAGSVLEAAVEVVVQGLRVYQAAEEESTVLSDLCATLRNRLPAAGIAFMARDRTGLASLASDGSRIDSSLAERIIATRQTIVPHAREGCVQGGVPVSYGNEILGALVARWANSASPGLDRATVVLTLAAAAAVAAMAGAIGARADSGPVDTGEPLGVSTAMTEVRRAVACAAADPFAVLVDGASGSGKVLVASSLHRHSPRRDRPFCALNCAALPDDLVEAELFGHARGAFTGAISERPGVFEEAHTGTLLLDEVGELSPRAQAKLLRTIQEGELRRVGDNLLRRIDVRIVSATNRDLSEEARSGRFRLDLLYRLDVVRIRVPPLRERREDVALLAQHFWREATNRMGSRAILGEACVAALTRYDWPGNVRELQNVLAALAVRSPKPREGLQWHFVWKCRYCFQLQIVFCGHTFRYLSNN